MAAGHGGQVLVSSATEELIIPSSSSGVELVSLGEQRLRDLLAPEALWQAVVDGLPGKFPALRTLDDVPGNLPLARSSCLGRAGDMARVQEALGRARVVSLVGVGGVGKTRLALQVSAELSGELPAGRVVL